MWVTTGSSWHALVGMALIPIVHMWTLCNRVPKDDFIDSFRDSRHKSSGNIVHRAFLLWQKASLRICHVW